MIQKIKSIKADFKESQSYNEIEIEFDFLNWNTNPPRCGGFPS
jgi:hypothetical protein